MNARIDQTLDLEAISALMVGQLRDDDAARALGMMTASGQARESWQLYHLVGDVLRSADLAACGQDRAFAARLAATLAAQRPAEVAAPRAPALSPHALTRPAANDGLFGWRMVAGLASFAAVAVIGWGMLGDLGPQRQGGAQLAQGAAAPRTALQTVAGPSPALSTAEPDEIRVADGPAVMLRDPRLDELLQAHRQVSATPALGGFVLNATYEGAGR